MTDFFRAHLGQTPLSADEQQGLIPSVRTHGELNELEQANISAAQAWAFAPRRLAGSEILTATYQLELHRRMFDGVWRWAGRLRTSDKTIGVAWAEVPSRLGELLGDARDWVDHGTYPPDEIVLRFHHRLVWIHPFANGNGRHARLATDVFAVKLGRPLFTWGARTGPDATIRAAYISALQAADHLDFVPLIAFARTGSLS